MIYQSILERKQKREKSFAVLIDPDRKNTENLNKIIEISEEAGVDYFFVGGSLLMDEYLDSCISHIRKHSRIPVVLFPGSPLQISSRADAILFLSLISGRNAEMLIGNHVIAAPILRKTPELEVISTGYMLIESGKSTSVSYMSSTQPIPADKPDIACCTAMAGEMLGLKLIFMDAGSGAHHSISGEMISKVSSCIQIPLIVGGGIRTPEGARQACISGADIVVIGNSIEKSPGLIREISSAVHEAVSL